LAEGYPFPDELLVWRRFLIGFSTNGLFSDVWSYRVLVYPSLPLFLAGLGNWFSSALGLATNLQANSFAEGIEIGRITLALAGLLAIPITYRIGRFFGAWRTSLAAASLVAFAPIVVGQTRYLSVDTILIATAAIALLTTLFLVEKQSPTRSALAGAACGLCFAAKFTGIILIAIPGTVLLANLGRRHPWQLLLCGTLLAGGALIVGMLGCPTCVIDPDAIFTQLRFYAEIGAASSVAPLAQVGPVPHSLAIFVFKLPHALGVLFTLALLPGILRATLRHEPRDLVLLGFAVLPTLPWIFSAVFFSRYYMISVPALAVLACAAFSSADRRSILARVALLVLVGGTLTQTLNWEHRYAVSSLERLHENILAKPDSAIGILSYTVGARGYGPDRALAKAGIPARPIRLRGPDQPPRTTGEAGADSPIYLANSCDSNLEVLLVDEKTLVTLARVRELNPGETASDLVMREAPCWTNSERFCEDCSRETGDWWLWRFSRPFRGTGPFEVFTRGEPHHPLRSIQP
jgi:hypothetical protein